jgi:hypothetical protein
MKAGPEPLRKAIPPSRADLVIAGAWGFPWYWLAELCAQEGLAVVRGPALSRKALHGGTANNDRMDAHTIAVLLRGGRLPPPSVAWRHER